MFSGIGFTVWKINTSPASYRQHPQNDHFYIENITLESVLSVFTGQ
jgi:hypothetical protein